MAWIVRKLFVSMLVPFLWRRWRDRDRTGSARQGRADRQPSGAASRR